MIHNRLLPSCLSGLWSFLGQIIHIATCPYMPSGLPARHLAPLTVTTFPAFVLLLFSVFCLKLICFVWFPNSYFFLLVFSAALSFSFPSFLLHLFIFSLPLCFLTAHHTSLFFCFLCSSMFSSCLIISPTIYSVIPLFPLLPPLLSTFNLYILPSISSNPFPSFSFPPVS